MISVQILEPSDTIEATDWARQLHHDGYARNNTYSGSPMNRMGWMQARFVCPFWIGKTVSEYTARCGPYEFVRGAVPHSHQEQLTGEELELCNIRTKPAKPRKETGWDRVQANRYKQED